MKRCVSPKYTYTYSVCKTCTVPWEKQHPCTRYSVRWGAKTTTGDAAVDGEQPHLLVLVLLLPPPPPLLL